MVFLQEVRSSYLEISYLDVHLKQEYTAGFCHGSFS